MAATGLLGCAIAAGSAGSVRAVLAPEPPTGPAVVRNVDVVPGLVLLKAQWNAMKNDPENIARLRNFLESGPPGRDGIVNRAEQLIRVLAQDPDAGGAAWRVAAIASLSLQSGALSALEITGNYRLPAGATGWDFGAENAKVQAGFALVTPETLETDEGDGPARVVAGATPLSGGLVNPGRLHTTLSNGTYRIMIVADLPWDMESGAPPFGSGIVINGETARPGGIDGMAPQTQRLPGDVPATNTSGSGSAHMAPGLGMAGWTIVRDGRIDIDFKDIPSERVIFAVIAEPIDLEMQDLDLEISEILASLLAGLDPAAGPAAFATDPGLSFGVYAPATGGRTLVTQRRSRPAAIQAPNSRNTRLLANARTIPGSGGTGISGSGSGTTGSSGSGSGDSAVGSSGTAGSGASGSGTGTSGSGSGATGTGAGSAGVGTSGSPAGATGTGAGSAGVGTSGSGASGSGDSAVGPSGTSGSGASGSGAGPSGSTSGATGSNATGSSATGSGGPAELTTIAVPAPGTFVLFGVALAILLAVRRRVAAIVVTG